MLTKDVTEKERAFRLACFNVLAHNRDDHAKNVSFLLDDATGRWSLAPAYDLTFSSCPGGEQSMLVMGEGGAPGVEHLRALAKTHGKKNGAAIVDEVRASVAHWPKHADAAGLTKMAAKLVADRIAPSAARIAKRKRPAKSNAAAKTAPTGSKM